MCHLFRANDSNWLYADWASCGGNASQNDKQLELLDANFMYKLCELFGKSFRDVSNKLSCNNLLFMLSFRCFWIESSSLWILALSLRNDLKCQVQGYEGLTRFTRGFENHFFIFSDQKTNKKDFSNFPTSVHFLNCRNTSLIYFLRFIKIYYFGSNFWRNVI